MMKDARFLMAAILGASSVAAFAQTPPPPPPAEAKAMAPAYVKAAGMSDLYEITSSKLAMQKSKSPQVRTFAAMLVKHHQQTTAATVKAAKKDGLMPMPPVLDAGAKASISELQAASPAEFDRVYLAQQVPAHQAALDLHQAYSTGGDKPALRASAKSAVPIVQEHLAAATKLQGSSTGM